jgi:uncharacterized protein YdhG (YjbR/CyaY superfamily)
VDSTEEKHETIDDYINAYPEDVQAILKKMRETIRKAAPEAEEAISYRIPTFRLNGNLVHFAAFKDHVSFFPTPRGILAFKKELSPYKVSKGTVQFPLDKPIPYELVRKITLFRRKQNLAKKP